MKIANLIREYVHKCVMKTGKRPGAVPVTPDELRQLREELRPIATASLTPTEDDLLAPEEVFVSEGIDLFRCDDAAERRAAA